MGGHITSWEDEFFNALGQDNAARLLALHLLLSRGGSHRKPGRTAFTFVGAQREIGLTDRTLGNAMRRLEEMEFACFDLEAGEAMITPGRAIEVLRKKGQNAAPAPAKAGAAGITEGEVEHG